MQGVFCVIYWACVHYALKLVVYTRLDAGNSIALGEDVEGFKRGVAVPVVLLKQQGFQLLTLRFYFAFVFI